MVLKRKKRKRGRSDITLIFIRAWNVLEGNIMLMCKIFNLSKRQCIRKASQLRCQGIAMCPSISSDK